MPWMACIPLMQEQLTVCEVWNWLQEKRFARNVPKAEGPFWLLFGQAKSDNGQPVAGYSLLRFNKVRKARI